MRIALDAMGGDQAPVSEVAGAIAASRLYGLEVVLVGRRAVIEAEIAKRDATGARLEIVDASDVVNMHESDPARAVRQRPDSSLVQTIRLVRNGEAAACVSAGNTGAAMAAALFELKRIPGVERPAVGIVLPAPRGRVLLLDVGANVDCRPEYLAQFGLMGSVYLQQLFGLESPRVALLSIGEESTKGNQQVQAAHPLLKEQPINFIGNVEGKDVFADMADVIVCDGFVGNVSLKLIEGLAAGISGMLREELTAKWHRKLLAGGLRGAFRSLRRRMDYAEYGGAPLLGVNGVCVLAHGRSTPYAMQHALRVAGEATTHGVIERLAEVIARTDGRKRPVSLDQPVRFL